MGVLYGFLVLVEMVVCALLIVVIFMQKSKGGMGGSAFGGGAGEAIFGSRMGNVLTKSTVVLGIIFLFNTLFLTVLTTQRGLVGSVMEGAPRRPAAQQPPAPGPGAGMDDWTEMDMPSAGDVAVPMDMPSLPEDMDADEVIQVPAVPQPEVDAPVATPDVVEDVEMPVLPDEDAADLGE